MDVLERLKAVRYTAEGETIVQASRIGPELAAILRSADLPVPSLFNTAVRSGLWSFLERSSRHWINLAVMIVLARLLGPAAFGTVAIASAYIVITEVMVRGGLPEYVIKHQASDEQIWTTIFWANTVLAVIVIGLTWLIATPAAWLFEVPELEAVLRALSLMLLVRALGATHEALIIRTFGFKALALRTLIASLVGGAVGIAMALSGFGVWSLVGERPPAGAMRTSSRRARRTPYGPLRGIAHVEAPVEVSPAGQDPDFASFLGFVWSRRS